MSHEEMKEKTLRGFREIFGDTEGVLCCFAPGRVNLIGEHTDYNGGHVFPCALTIGTYAAARKRKDRRLRLYSLNLPGQGITETSLDDFSPLKDNSWTAYPKGVMWAFSERGMVLDEGMDIVIYGNIPNGSGLSSSASLEVLTGFLIRELYGFKLTNQEIALIGQYSENNYNGMNCGIMDQFASAMGKKDNAIFLDTASLSFEYAPVMLQGMRLIVTNTNKKHKLVGSAYNDRRRESEEALTALKTVLDLNALGGLSDETFDSHAELIKDPIVRKRARHAVYENNRTLRAVDRLKAGDIYEFGRLMNLSHISLRDDYEVSCRELDVLAETAWSIPGVLGSRMTGGGFGGCTVSIVKEEAIPEFKRITAEKYLEEIRYECSFYEVSIGDGPTVL